MTVLRIIVSSMQPHNFVIVKLAFMIILLIGFAYPACHNVKHVQIQLNVQHVMKLSIEYLQAISVVHVSRVFSISVAAAWDVSITVKAVICLLFALNVIVLLKEYSMHPVYANAQLTTTMMVKISNVYHVHMPA